MAFQRGKDNFGRFLSPSKINNIITCHESDMLNNMLIWLIWQI